MELPSWTVAVPFIILASVLVLAAFHERERLAGLELRRLMRKAKLPDPGSDWGTLVVRQGRRYAGRVIGLFVVFVGSIPFIGWSIAAGDRSGPWWLLILPVGHALGTAAGHLRQVTIAPPAARVAVMRRRQLLDYVRPLEVCAAAGSTVLPAAAVALATVTLTQGTSTPAAVIIVALAGVVSLALLAVLWWVVRMGLRQPVAATSDAGLEWGEVLRSQLLHDQLGAITVVSALGGGGVLMWAFGTGMRGLPDWTRTAVPIAAAVAVVLVVVLIAAALADRHFAWVRTHVVVGQRG